VRVLLDTHALLWWLADDPALPATARNVIARPGNTLMVSAASAWEISTKFRLGKLPDAADLLADFEGYLGRERLQPLPVSVQHALRAGSLPGPHKDPFDRMLIAQAATEGLTLVSADRQLDPYDVPVLDAQT